MSKYGYFGDAGAPFVSGDTNDVPRPNAQASSHAQTADRLQMIGQGQVLQRAQQRDAVDPRGAQAMALFMQLDERGKKTALAMLAVAVKLHAEVKG